MGQGWGGLVGAWRLAVVRSASGPLRPMWAAIYRGVAWGTVLALRLRFPGAVESACLRGSTASSLLVPALSDVDLFVVLRPTVSPERHEQVRVFYLRLAAAVPVLDPHPWILRWQDVEALYRENPSFRFRVLEGQQAFHVVFGVNRLTELPALDPSSVLVAHLFDLKSRLTYFNAFCLAGQSGNALDRARGEYMLFKLTLDLVRLARTLATGESPFQRAVVADGYDQGVLALETSLGIGDDALLRRFVAHTVAWRLRRSFFDTTGVTRDDVEGHVLHAILALCVGYYAHPALRDSAALASEHEHFYDGAVFRPTGRPVCVLPEDRLAQYGRLKAGVAEARTAGADAVLAYRGLRVNLGNTDARIAHCSVVASPEGGP